MEWNFSANDTRRTQISNDCSYIEWKPTSFLDIYKCNVSNTIHTAHNVTVLEFSTECRRQHVHTPSDSVLIVRRHFYRSHQMQMLFNNVVIGLPFRLSNLNVYPYKKIAVKLCPLV